MANRAKEQLLVPLRKLFAAEQYKQLSDEQLLQCFVAEREEGAFAALMNRHGPMVLGVCQSVLRHAQDAEDVCQASFLVLARKSGSIRNRTAVARWLHGVAYRMAKKLAASKNRVPRQVPSDQAPSSPEDDLSWREVRQIVHEELERLPQKYRKPLILCYLEGQTQEEAALQLGCSGGALKGMLTRGRDLLKRRLTQRGLGAAALLATPLASPTLAAGVVKTTASSALLLLSGKTVGAGISAQAAALVKSGLKGMVMTKLKVGAAVVLVLGLVMGGMTLAGFRPGMDDHSAAPRKGGNKAVSLVHLHDGQAKGQGLPKEKGQPGRGVDLQGDVLPVGASARLGTVRWRHTTLVDFTAFSPDGKTVVSADEVAIHVWEFPSGKLIRRIDLPFEDDPTARATKATPGGAKFVVYSMPVALSKDGKTVACFFKEKNKILCYEIATGKLLSEAFPDTFNRGAGAVHALDFSPSGEELASLDERGLIHIWNWRKGVELRRFGNASNVAGVRIGVKGSNLAYAPDGKAIANIHVNQLQNQRHLQLWDAATGAEIRSISTPQDVQTSSSRPVWSPDGKILAYSGSNTITLVDAATGKDLRKVTHENRLAGGAMVFGKDGTKLYSRGVNLRVVAEWDVGTGKLLRTFGNGPPFQGIPLDFGQFRGMSLSPDGNSLSLDGLEQVPEFIDLPSGKEIAAPAGHVKPVVQLQFSTDSKTLRTLASGSNMPLKKSMRQWDVVTGKDLGPIVLPESTPQVAASPDGQTLAVATFSRGKQGPAKVVLIDSSTGKEIREVAEGQPALAFSNDGKTLALRNSQQGRIELYTVATAKLLRAWSIKSPEPQGPKTGKIATRTAFNTMFFSPDGKKLAAFSDPTTLGVWDTGAGKQVGSVPMPKDAQILSGAFSPEGRTVALGLDDGTAALYEVASGQRRLTFGEKPPAKKSDNDKVLDTMFRFISLADGSCVAFSPDGKLVAHASQDKVVRLWDVATGKTVAEFRGHTGRVLCLAFAPNGRWLASGSADTTTLIWDVGS